MCRLDEVVKLIRTKLTANRSTEWKTVTFALLLCEALAKNCGVRYLRVMGDPRFMDDLKKIAKVCRVGCFSFSPCPSVSFAACSLATRLYHLQVAAKKSSSDAREALTKCLELVQVGFLGSSVGLLLVFVFVGSMCGERLH